MLWLAQAAQSDGAAVQASVDAVERALADFTSALEAAGLSLILVVLVCVNVLLGFSLYASSRNSCGCSKCRGSSMRQVLLGVSLNMVAFFLSTWRHIDTIVSRSFFTYLFRRADDSSTSHALPHLAA